jgi:transcriptional regulator with XRE-family HTH domain
MKRDAADLYAQIEARRAELGLTQAELGFRAFGKSETSAIQNIKRGSSPSFERLGAIADALGFDLFFGSPRDSDPVKQILVDGTAYAHIPLHDAALAAGEGSENHSEHVIEQLAFRRDWLKKQGISATAACLARVQGESMLPTIAPGDVVLIDTRQRNLPIRSLPDTEVRHRAPIYALRGADGAQVKRLLRPTENQLMVISDNPDYLPQVMNLALGSNSPVIGKVVWWGHTVKE